MRVVLIGTSRERRSLRDRLDHSASEIVGEFESLADARRAGVAADGVLSAFADGDHDDLPLAESLTPREIQVLELVAEGLPNKAIAARLGISDQTVKFHLASITGKLGAANRTDAVRRAVRQGLVAL